MLFYPYDMTKETSPSEVGLGWAVSKRANYRGKAAAEALKGKERVAFCGAVIDHDDTLMSCETLLVDGKEVQTMNSPIYSRRAGKYLALAHAIPEATSSNRSIVP